MIDVRQTDSKQTPHPLQAMIAIAIIITTILEHIRIYIQEIPIVGRKTTQVLKIATTKINCTRFMQNIRKSYRTAMLAITIVTSMTNHTSHINQQQTIIIIKILQAPKNLATNMMDCSSHIHPVPTANATTTKTSCRPVTDVLCKDQMKHPNTQTENSK